MPWHALRLVFLASNSLYNLRGQRYLHQIHRIKLKYVWMYGFMAKLSVATFNICQILMRSKGNLPISRPPTHPYECTQYKDGP